MIAVIGTSDQPRWLAEACKILLHHLPLHLLVLLQQALHVPDSTTGTTFHVQGDVEECHHQGACHDRCSIITCT